MDAAQIQSAFQCSRSRDPTAINQIDAGATSTGPKAMVAAFHQVGEKVMWPYDTI